MTRLTVNIENKKTEKAIKAVLDALGLDYNIDHFADGAKQQLNKSEQLVYNRLKKTAADIKLYKSGKIEFQEATEFLNEL